MILIKLTSRSRPEKFFRALDNVNIMSRGSKWRVWATLDEDDRSMNNESVRDRLTKYPNLYYNFGKSKNKIDAINRDMDMVGEWDILINMSDDQIFVEEAFDKIIERDMAEHFPDLDGFLHYNDNQQRANVPTMSIMGKKYYDRFGYIYNPEYQSLWCDVEAMDVAKLLGRWKYMGDDKVIFHHLHPAWGKAEWDDQYRKTESTSMWVYDEAVYKRRKQFNFGFINPDTIRP